MLKIQGLQVHASPRTKQLVGTTGHFFEVVVPEWWILSTSEIYLTSLVSRRRWWCCMWPMIILVVWFLNWQGASNTQLDVELHVLNLGLFLCMTVAGARLPPHTLWSDVCFALALAVHLVISAYWSKGAACFGGLQWVICLACMGVHTTVLAGFLGVVHVGCLGFISNRVLLISASAYVILLNALLESVLADQNATVCGNESTIATLLTKGDGSCIVKRNTGEVFKADSRFCEVFGEDCVGSPFLALVDPEERDKLDPVFKDCSTVPGEPITVSCTREASGLTARFNIMVSTRGSSCVCSVSGSQLIGPARLEGLDELSEWDLESCHSHQISASSLAYSQATSALSTSALSQSSAGLSQGSVPRMGPLATQLLQGFSHTGPVSDQIRRLQLDAPRAIQRSGLPQVVGRPALSGAKTPGNPGRNKGTQTAQRTISRSVQTVSARRAVAQAAEAMQAA